MQTDMVLCLFHVYAEWLTFINIINERSCN